MAVAAPARRAPAKRAAPAKRTAPARRRTARPRSKPSTGRFVPVAVVGRTAGAVGGIADSGLVLRLTRGRLWIGALGALLVGIVALNVMALSFSSSSSNAARQADSLRQQNSALRADLAQRLSYEQVQRTASKLGLTVPAPGATRYLEPSPNDAAEAAKRLKAGELSNQPAPPPATTAPADSAVAVPTETAVDPAAAAVAETAPAEAVAPPVEGAPATTAPAEPATTPAPAGGGVAPPQ